MKLFKNHQQKVGLLLLWVAVATFGRIIPHLPNVTPLMGLSLLAGSVLARREALGVTLVSLLLSDALLAYFLGYSWLGSWSLFTYSGFLIVTLVGARLANNDSVVRIGGYALSLSLAYWLWTNFGVWLVSPMYGHSTSGLVACYTAALPFSRNALAGDLVWTVGLFYIVARRRGFFLPA